MRILITGVFGFVGSHLTRLLQDTHDVTGVWNNQFEEEQFKNIALINASEIDSIEIEPDIVILCHAAVSSGNMDEKESVLQKSNVAFTQTITKRFPDSYFIYLSSASVYKESKEKITENSETDALSPYAKSKLQAENIISKLNASCILRLPSLFGSNMKERTIVPIYVNQALKNKEILVFGKGSRAQNYLSITELIQCVLNCVEKQPKGLFLVVGKEEHTNLELASIISKYLSAKLTFVKEDNSVSCFYNNEVSKLALGVTSGNQFEQEIKNYIDWKRKQS
ncbi:MAG: UDP-glucose 4-epimerase [Glaciecola sp.]|jgi:UDP-glucose 4-epimerase